MEVTTCLKHVRGVLYGVINRPRNRTLDLGLLGDASIGSNKEDVLRSILWFIEDGLVVRFSRVAYAAQYYHTHGGLGTLRARLGPTRKASETLLRTYPQYGCIKGRPSGMTDFQLKRIRPPL